MQRPQVGDLVSDLDGKLIGVLRKIMGDDRSQPYARTVDALGLHDVVFIDAGDGSEVIKIMAEIRCV